MPQLFPPYADTVARSVLIAIVVLPFISVAFAYWISASEYVTGRSITYDQPIPFSHAHHVGGLGLDCRTAPRCRDRTRTPAYRGTSTGRACACDETRHRRPQR
jgi:hypothetical protein